jgi:hypothetical protein
MQRYADEIRDLALQTRERFLKGNRSCSVALASLLRDSTQARSAFANFGLNVLFVPAFGSRHNHSEFSGWLPGFFW